MRRPPGPRQWHRQPRTPSRHSADRRASSGLVSFPRIARMIRLRPSGLIGARVSERPAISLFSGAGGLDLGVERAGYRVRVMLERNKDACATLRANFPDAEVMEDDIRAVKPAEILARAELQPGEAELLVGGPPCTPFSKSGYWLAEKRNGTDPDADLLSHYLQVLEAARPRTFILENVFGLAYRRQGSEPWLAHLLDGASRLGYQVQHRVLLAADYGVPQLRQRVFIVGGRDHLPSLPEPTHSGPHERRHYNRDLLPHVTAGEAIADLAERPDLAEPTERVNGGYGHLLPDIPPGDNYLYYTEKRGHPNPLFKWRSRYWSFLLKLDPDRPSPTIQAQPGPNVGPFHWENRRLRIPEIKRLQTFPDAFRIVGSRRSAQAQLGNAVPPLLGATIVRRADVPEASDASPPVASTSLDVLVASGAPRNCADRPLWS